MKIMTLADSTYSSIALPSRLFPSGSVWFVLLIAALIRGVGICYGVPFTFGNIDEYVPVANAINFLQMKSLQPVHFNYPALYFYSLSVLYAIWYIMGWIMGVFSSSVDFATLFITQPGYFHLAGRILTALLGTMTVLLVYKIGKKLSGTDAGIFASILLTFGSLHTELSHWALPDVPMTFLFTLAFLWMLNIKENGSLREYITAGVIAGAAVATKYNAAMIVLPFLVVHAWRIYKNKESWNSVKMLAAFCAMGGTFLILNPYWLLEFSRAFDALRFESTHMNVGHIGQEGTKFSWPFVQLFEHERLIGLLYLAALLFLLTWKNRVVAAMIGAPVLVSILYIGSWSKASLHYLVFIFPLLAVLAGVWLNSIVRTTFFSGRQWLVMVTILVLVAPQVEMIVRSDCSMLMKDTREEAKNWIEANIPQGATLAFASREGIPPLVDSVGIYFDGTRKTKFISLMKSGNPFLRERIDRFRVSHPTYHLFEAKRILTEPMFPSSWQSKIDTTNPYMRALFSIHWATISELHHADVHYVLVSSYDTDPLETTSVDRYNPLSYSVVEGKRFFSEITANPSVILVHEWQRKGIQLGPRIRLFEVRELNEL